MPLTPSDTNDESFGFLYSLTSVVSGTFNQDGLIFDANQGLRKLLEITDDAELASVDIRPFFLNPRFEDLNKAPLNGSATIFQGFLTLTSKKLNQQTFKGSIFKHKNGYLLVAEYDIDSLVKLNTTVLQLNQELAEKQREIIRTNNTLKIKEKTITEMMLTDPLTSLPNRRHLTQIIESEAARLARKKSPLSIAIADIDHFKSINDSYGHDIGDEVLVAFAKRLKAALRKGDFIARIGGEEFVLLFPDTPLNEAIAITDRLRACITGKLNEKLDHSVTASFGISELAPQEDYEKALKRADNGLYEAKQRGRNCVIANPA